MQHQVNFHIDPPKYIDDTHYVDLISIDGITKTYLMHKISEPNIFGILKEENGNTIDTISV